MKARRPEPAEIEFKNMRFLIMDRPTDATMEKFIEVCTYYYIIILQHKLSTISGVLL